ncbi:MAG: diguanylate cyclase [Pseudomonadota bacterium]
MILLTGYSILELLSQSMPTSIYRGLRQSDGSPVVIKLLDVAFPSPVQLARVRHEYELLGSLSHPGIIRVHALEKANNSLAIVMEDFGGIPLRTFLSGHALSVGDKLRIAHRISEILAEVHARGIVHKDINPNNILINPESSEIKLIDFGYASRIGQEDSQLVHPDQLEGTLAYIAPEQTGRMNRPVDYRSDYYSLGITMYELLTGRRPFDAQDGMEMVHMHIAAVPPAPHDVEPSIPPIASRIVQKLIEKNAELRYQSAEGLSKDLHICLEALNGGLYGGDFVAGAHDVSERFNIPARLYGRDAEIGQLMAAYDHMCEGRPGLVLVSGHSGIGKSSLIQEIHKPIARRRGFFIAGKFDQYRRNIPYAALIQAFQNLLHQLLTESEERIAAWRGHLRAAMGENAALIADVIPELRHILGELPPVMPLAAQEAENRFNYYFVNFVQVFAQAEHPLTLFLDDLQWADQPSLNLMERLAAHGACSHLLIIGAYRQNEVDASHPLSLALARMRNEGCRMDDIHLQALPSGVVGQIVADTLNCSTDEVQALAALIYRNTHGNPFFVSRLLSELHETGQVTYDRSQRKWVWDIARIERVGMADNVVELMTANILRLPEATRGLLNLAACIGNQFTLDALSMVDDSSRDVIAQTLHPALQERLLVPVGNEYRYFGGAEVLADEDTRAFGVNYRFQHDRIQQAAYDLSSAEEKIAVHYKVGKLLLQSTPEEALDEMVFDIVNHFDLAAAHVTDAGLRLQLAALNLRAGIRAKNAIAYAPAVKYIQHAEQFLEGAEAQQQALHFRLLSEHAECEYLNGDSAAAERCFMQALDIAANDAERAVVLEAMIHFHTNTGNYRKAYQTGRQALKLFGVSLPAGFVPPLFLADLARLKWRMRGRKVADLLDLPLCNDERMRTAMRLIAALLKAAYQIRPELCVANAVKAVNLSLQHGMMEDNAVAYLVFGGIFLGGVLGRHQAGYEFGQLALAMNARFDNLKQRSEINFVSGYFTHFWLKHARDTEAYYRAAYESGLQTGDYFHLSCAACTLVESQFIRGVPLAEVQKLAADHLHFMERIGSTEQAGAITATLRTILNLEGLTDGASSFGDPDFSEAAFATRLETFTSKHFAHFYWVNKMQALYLWRRADEALAVAAISAKYLKHSLAMLHTVEHHFYHALILCAVCDAAPQQKHLRKAKRILKRFEQWSLLNPANFEHKALLIRAEIARLEGATWEVSDLYTRAIRSADEHGYMQNKALANELAGRFFNTVNVESAARSHLREAYYGYQLWGASGIADNLAQAFPFVAARHAQDALSGSAMVERSFGATSVASTSVSHGNLLETTSSSRRRSGLDMETVIKSTQAISGEIKLATLLQKLMKIMIENAGAERGSFIRVVHGDLLLEAEGAVHDEAVKICGGVPPDAERLPLSVVQYVARLGESVLLNDAESDARFWEDPYIVRVRPKSLLCSPIMHHGQVIGVVLLENNLASGAFTPARIELLQMLSAQAAISIENSQLYAGLEQRVQERTRELSLATEQLKAANEELEKLSYTDALTQVANKRHFQKVMDEEWRRASRTGSELAIMLIDIDCFKLYNDNYGHLEGDRCLKAVATAISNTVCRVGDLVARFGGEEFVVLLPHTTRDDARSVAQRVVESVRALAIPHHFSLAGNEVSISLGLAQAVPDQDADPLILIDAADRALYRAKESGRNRYCEA